MPQTGASGLIWVERALGGDAVSSREDLWLWDMAREGFTFRYCFAKSAADAFHGPSPIRTSDDSACVRFVSNTNQ